MKQLQRQSQSCHEMFKKCRCHRNTVILWKWKKSTKMQMWDKKTQLYWGNEKTFQSQHGFLQCLIILFYEHFPTLCEYLGPKGCDVVAQVMTLPGDTGFPGQVGEKGEPGERGPQGLRGPEGTMPQTQCTSFLWSFLISSYICIISHLLGTQGQRGSRGADGGAGRNGIPGPKGDTGPKGTKGKS